MSLDKYTSLLDELAANLNIKLRPDKNNSCLIKYPNKIEVQIEFDSSQEWVVIVSTIGTLPPGRYREEVLSAALKANYILEPHCGCFAYTPKGDRLIFYKRLPVKYTNGIHVADLLVPFTERVSKWTEMVEHGEIPVVRSQAKAAAPGGLFGIT